MASTRSFVVAIDGPAASGKGTLARRLAERFSLAHLDTGKLYRAAAALILEAGGGTRIILISATTRFRGLRASTALQANDSVVIVGQPNADGTVGAREVQVIGVSR